MDIKNFYIATEGDQIFEACGMILSKEREGIFIYNTDGLIFTPALTGVGSDRIGVAGRMRKETWEHSFKWKPPKYNTIDLEYNEWILEAIDYHCFPKIIEWIDDKEKTPEEIKNKKKIITR